MVGLKKELLPKWRRGETDDNATVHGVDYFIQEPFEEQEQVEVVQPLPTPFTLTRIDILGCRKGRTGAIQVRKVRRDITPRICLPSTCRAV